MSSIVSMKALPPPAPVPSLSITPHIPGQTLAELVVLMTVEFIALACVSLRTYIRLTMDRRLFFNDYAMLVALLLASVDTFTALAVMLQGVQGFHVAEIVELVPERVIPLGKLFLVAQVFWGPSNTAIKVSILEFYLRLFGRNRNFRISTYIILGVVICNLLIATLSIFALCTPFAFNWNPSIKNGHCGSRKATFLGTGIINLALDLSIIVLPMPVLWSLKMPTKKKIGLACMFSIGFAICAITIWRIIIIQNINFSDPYIDFPFLALSSCLEPLLGIVTGCLPILRRSTLFHSPILAIKSAIAACTGRSAGGKSMGDGTTDATPPVENNHASTRNFHRLYDHLYVMSSPGPKSQVATCTADPIELEEGLSHRAGDEDTIKLTTEWDVRSSVGPRRK